MGIEGASVEGAGVEGASVEGTGVEGRDRARRPRRVAELRPGDRFLGLSATGLGFGAAPGSRARERPRIRVLVVGSTGPGWLTGVAVDGGADGEAGGGATRFLWDPRGSGEVATAEGDRRTTARATTLANGAGWAVAAYAGPLATTGARPTLLRLEDRDASGARVASVVCEAGRLVAEVASGEWRARDDEARGALAGVEWVAGVAPAEGLGRAEWRLVGGAAIRRRTIRVAGGGAFEPGTLLVAEGIAFEPGGDGVAIARLEAPVAVGRLDDRELGAFLPARARPPGEVGYDLDAVEGAEALAVAAATPSEAVVAADGEGGKVALSATGLAFHRVGDEAADVVGDPPGAGLWLFAGARWRGGGWDDECDLEGTWRPAEAADLARHGLARGADEAIAEALDLEPPDQVPCLLDPAPGLAVRWMAKARVAMEAGDAGRRRRGEPPSTSGVG